MSQTNDTTIYKAGQIQTRKGKKGIEFYAFNFQHGKEKHIGSIQGCVYEKTAPILYKPVPSFSLPQSELAKLKEQGAAFIRFIARGAFGTYSISVEDYERFGEPYFNQSYGPQIRVALKYFQRSEKIGKRNAVIDNPPVMRSDPFEPVKNKQMSLF